MRHRFIVQDENTVVKHESQTSKEKAQRRQKDDGHCRLCWITL